MKRIESIARFEQHRQRALELMSRDLSDEVLFSALAMEVFQAVNSLIEVGQALIASRRLPLPDTYRQVFDVLCRQRAIARQTAEVGKRLVYLRNLIAHEYHMISEQELLDAVHLLTQMDEMVELARREVLGEHNEKHRG